MIRWFILTKSSGHPSVCLPRISVFLCSNTSASFCEQIMDSLPGSWDFTVYNVDLLQLISLVLTEALNCLLNHYSNCLPPLDTWTKFKWSLGWEVMRRIQESRKSLDQMSVEAHYGSDIPGFCDIFTFSQPSVHGKLTVFYSYMTVKRSFVN